MSLATRQNPKHVRAALLGPAGVVSGLVLATSVAATAQLTDGVLENGDLAVVDPVVAAAVPGLRTPAVTVFARTLDLVGGTAVVTAAAVLVAALLWFRVRDRVAAAWVAGTMALTGILVVGAKHLVGRARPGADLVLGPVDTTPAFPSGHTLGTTVFLGLLAWLAVRRSRSVAAWLLAVLTWVAGSVLMAASRVYLGYHWTTDVLAGLALGAGVLALAALLGAALHRSPRSD